MQTPSCSYTRLNGTENYSEVRQADQTEGRGPTPNPSASIVAVDPSQPQHLTAQENELRNFAAPNATTGTPSYGAIECVSSQPACSLNSENAPYHPEGILVRMAQFYSAHIFNKELADIASYFSCSSPEVDSKSLAPARDTFLELAAYTEKYPRLKNSSSFEFHHLLHDLHQLERDFPPAYFRDQAARAIKEKHAEQQSLRNILTEKVSCLTELQQAQNEDEPHSFEIDQLQTEIAQLKKKNALLDVFVAYHQKALAVNEYMESYNCLKFYASPKPAERFNRFEKATQQLEGALLDSQTANAALLIYASKPSENEPEQTARSLFKELAARDHQKNPCELVLCPEAGNFTPVAQANEWTCERLQRDLKIEVEKAAAPQSNSYSAL